MYNFYKYNILPTERLSKTSNTSLYTIRFKELAKKRFYLENNNLYFIKSKKTNRLANSDFFEREKVILKKIPYIYEVLQIINKIHLEYGHISYRSLAKKFMEKNYFLDGIELISEEFSK